MKHFSWFFLPHSHIPKYQKQTKLYTILYYEIPKKIELPQISVDCSSDINFKEFIEIYKKCTAKGICSKIMAISDKIKDEQLLYDINRKCLIRLRFERYLSYHRAFVTLGEVSLET